MHSVVNVKVLSDWTSLTGICFIIVPKLLLISIEDNLHIFIQWFNVCVCVCASTAFFIELASNKVTSVPCHLSAVVKGWGLQQPLLLTELPSAVWGDHPWRAAVGLMPRVRSDSGVHTADLARELRMFGCPLTRFRHIFQQWVRRLPHHGSYN